MLNLSPVSISNRIDNKKYSALWKLEQRSISNLLVKVLTGFFIIVILAMFLPWTQNIRTKGYVTTLNPYDRPQAIQTLIDGRVEKWFVREGDYVQAGDTILQISESKESYLAPELLENTENRLDAKLGVRNNYSFKLEQLQEQYVALVKNRDFKLKQIDIKRNQLKSKLAADSTEVKALEIKKDNTFAQYKRAEGLLEKGIRSETEVEKRFNVANEAQAKWQVKQTALGITLNEIVANDQEEEVVKADFENKLAKLEKERISTLSDNFETENEVNKLAIELSNYKMRSDAYYIKSPIDGYITQSMINGIGEYVKAGQDLMSIMPYNFELAVEMYVMPRDMPLLKKNQKVRILFDGWPAIIFSGWPNNSYGTFAGRVFAIDNFISENGKYRVLVSQDPDDEEWPEELRVGGGANSLVLLNNVRVYYELWRQLNGFPPDYYSKEKPEQVKQKEPLRKVK